MTTWDSVNCSDVEYLVEISGRIRNSPQALMEVSSYWLPITYFEIPMPCGTAYNLTVRSRNSAGVSEPSSAFAGVTGTPRVLFWTMYVFKNGYLDTSDRLTQRHYECNINFS